MLGMEENMVKAYTEMPGMVIAKIKMPRMVIEYIRDAWNGYRVNQKCKEQ